MIFEKLKTSNEANDMEKTENEAHFGASIFMHTFSTENPVCRRRVKAGEHGLGAGPIEETVSVTKSDLCIGSWLKINDPNLCLLATFEFKVTFVMLVIASNVVKNLHCVIVVLGQ